MTVLISLVTLYGYGWLWPQPVQAANPPVDAACRGCHDETNRQLAFPSGETVSLQVDLVTLDRSAHSALAPEPSSCRDCHINGDGYRYPHLEQTTPSHQEFVAAITQNCQNCHYPHRPFHLEEEATNAVESSETPATRKDAANISPTLVATATQVISATRTTRTPTCVDCHGSHDIDWMVTITNSMPANCLVCHSDRTIEWTAKYITPRPGLGKGAEGYIGSARCAGCHEDQYFSWQGTLHARMVQSAAHHPEAIVGDFDQDSAVRTFAKSDVRYTIGSAWKQLYLSQTVEGQHFLLPAQWNVQNQEWVAYEADTGEGAAWLENCGSCHVTGLDTQTWGFTEFSIGCESCHGPGQTHAKDPEQVTLFAEVDDQVCGACHSRGASPAGHPFPASYRPGDVLADHFTLATDDHARWPDGSARLNNQQYTDWQIGNRMLASGQVQCVTCHTVHDEGAAAHQLRQPLNELCLQCHTEQKALVAHAPFHEQAIVNKRHEFTCADCHMPQLASRASAFDVRIHTFLQPNPQGTLDYGGLATMPNACNRCHQQFGEDPEWAAQTIAFVRQEAEAKPASFFGPGPTPTSPPPPTPISVAGQPGVPQEPGLSAWLRPALITIFWLLGALVAIAIFNTIRLRRVKNA